METLTIPPRLPKKVAIPLVLNAAERDHISQKSDDPTEIRRRQAQPAGTLIREQEHKGVIIAANMTEALRAHPGGYAYAARRFGRAAVRNARFNFIRGDVGYKPINIPQLYTEIKGQHYTPADVQAMVRSEFMHNEGYAADVVDATKNKSRHLRQMEEGLGRSFGRLAFLLATTSLTSEQLLASPKAIQADVKQSSIDIMQESHYLEGDMRVPLSFAQLAEPDSDWVKHLKTTAPFSVVQTHKFALQDVNQ